MDLNDAIVTLEDIVKARASLASGIPDSLVSEISAVVGEDAFEHFKATANPHIIKVLDDLITLIEGEIRSGTVLTHGELNDRMHVASLSSLSERISLYIANGGFTDEQAPLVHAFTGGKPKFTVLEDDKGILAASQEPAVNRHPPVKLGMDMFLKTAMVVAA